jgi:small basic protein (TIGR04137 family)
MSMHQSLKGNNKGKKRSVRKRWERMRSLMLQKKFDKEKQSVFGLPKEKVVRFKIKKEKKEKENLSLVDIVQEQDKKE